MLCGRSSLTAYETYLSMWLDGWLSQRDSDEVWKWMMNKRNRNTHTERDRGVSLRTCVWEIVCQSAVAAVSREPHQTNQDTMISTECQEQQQLTVECVSMCVCLHGSVCVQHLYTGASLCVYVCVCVRVPRQKQRNPNTQSRISINITGCQSTSNNAAVISDNINTSSCGKPEKLPRERAPSEPRPALTIKGNFTTSALRLKSECEVGRLVEFQLSLRLVRSELMRVGGLRGSRTYKHHKDSKSQRSVPMLGI